MSKVQKEKPVLVWFSKTAEWLKEYRQDLEKHFHIKFFSCSKIYEDKIPNINPQLVVFSSIHILKFIKKIKEKTDAPIVLFTIFDESDTIVQEIVKESKSIYLSKMLTKESFIKCLLEILKKTKKI